MPIGDEFTTEGRPYASAPQPTVITMPPPKSRLIYILLAIFLGSLGIHNFYCELPVFLSLKKAAVHCPGGLSWTGLGFPQLLMKRRISS